MSAQKLAREVPCSTCGATANDQCRTSSGRPSPRLHTARTWPLHRAWTQGYADGMRAGLDNPEWANRALRDWTQP